MDKASVYAQLVATTEINTFRHTQLWDRAFKLYNEAHPKDQKQPTCGSCYKYVKAWLQS